MAAYCEVGFLFDEEKLTVGGGEAADGVVDLFGGVDRGQLREDERHERVLPEAGDDLARGVGEQGGFVLVDFAEGAGEIVGIVDGVRVGEEEIASLCGLGSRPAGVVLAGEASACGEIEGGASRRVTPW